MEFVNKTSTRSISPSENSYDTSTDKELYISHYAKYNNASSHRRIISSDQLNIKLESPPSIGKFCGNCIKLERGINDLRKKLQKEINKNEVREKHMKQLDSLLQIKDKRLKEEEISLKSERNQLLYELNDANKIVKETEAEKNKIENEYKRMSKEYSNLLIIVKKTETKYAEIQKGLKMKSQLIEIR